MVVISDTSAISNLLQIDQLHLLKQLYGKILIPFSIYEELTAFHDGGLLNILSEHQIFCCHVPETSLSEIVREQKLDRGETEAIILAKLEKADLLIIDESKGRQVAVKLDLRIIGILGVIRDAKEEGLINQLKPLLDDLRLKTTFRFSDFLYNKLLFNAGEK